jgi:galactokinase
MGDLEMDKIEQLKGKFVELYGDLEHTILTFYAPGRVNLIGEHTDYNGGYVFPAALTVGTTMLIRENGEDTARFASTHFETRKEVKLSDISYKQEDDWVNYPKAVLHHLGKRGHIFKGADVLYHGEIPNGSGLSSSASIEVVTGYGFMSLAGHPLDKIELSLIAQEAENEFMGVNCGIMDQFAVTMGRKDHAILLKCDTLDYELVPFSAKGYKLVIGNTNKRRGLVDSEYNKRRSQCEEAVRSLGTKFAGLSYLCELSPEEYFGSRSLIQDDVVRRRAEHVITENDRVLASVKALRDNQLEEFGRLMNLSHASLRDLYEVTCLELDVMVEEAQLIPGVLGSRMTGAGFGGCTVSLVAEDSVERFITEVGQAYKDRTDLTADFYVSEIGDGVKKEE